MRPKPSLVSGGDVLVRVAGTSETATVTACATTPDADNCNSNRSACLTYDG
jgi:hypothetical protein